MTLRLHVLSDLHLEFGDFDMPSVEADLLILAGDISDSMSTVEAAIEWSQRYRLGAIIVLGNHELYHHSYPSQYDVLKRAAAGTSVRVMENETAYLDGVRFLCCTLWTDFQLYGIGHEIRSRKVAQRGTNDYALIQHDSGRLITTLDTVLANRVSVEYLTRTLHEPSDDEPWTGETVVVTHHAPSARSVNKLFRADHPLNPAYASNLDHLTWGVHTWIHGHTHQSMSYMINGCRVMSNCRGYVGDVGRPDPNFDPSLVIEV